MVACAEILTARGKAKKPRACRGLGVEKSGCWLAAPVTLTFAFPCVPCG